MHINALTGFWNLVAGVGVGFSLSVLPQYFTARKGVSESIRLSVLEQKAAIRLAHHYIWAEASRLSCHTISLVLGVWSLFLPQVPPQPDRPQAVVTFGFNVVLGLIAINCLTVQNSIRAYLAWRRA
jgi:hypothetical protein